MFGQYHPLAYDTGEGERLIGSLTGPQVFWLGLGLFLSYQMAQVVPTMAFIPQGLFPLRYLHYLLPLGACWLMQWKLNGLPVYRGILFWIAFQRRPRTLVWRRKHVG